ncbi:MAG: YscQ/HrcQ family type III secretion apparatus protein [Chlamydiae bacterium]|nr:YscQ/HrcQ family type III secretion apparatus protein [Chlamydiota bacterium]
MNHSPPLLNKITSAIKESLSIPMWGQVPPFPWEKFLQALRDTLQMQELTFASKKAEWKEAEKLLEGLGEHPFITSLVLSPLVSSCFLAIPQEDAKRWTSLFLEKEGKKLFIDDNLRKGFFQFNLLHILQTLYDLNPYPGLTAQLDTHALPHEKSYCVDISLEHTHGSTSCRMIFPASFHNIVTSHFQSTPFSLKNVDAALELTLKVQVGKVALSHEEWKEIKMGDFVVLDLCTYSPTTQQGSFLLTLENTPLFIVKAKNGELKILDYALYEQKEMPMIDDTHNPSGEEEDFMEDDEDFEDFEDEEIPEENAEAPLEELVSPEEVPLSLCVEITHIKMPLNKLLSLQPGNTLPLAVSLAHGVAITLNSQVIARGELLQLGEMLGVKISEVGH